MKIFVTVLILIASAAPQNGDHAPTLEQCRADLNLWQSPTRDNTKELTFHGLMARFIQLSTCAHAYKQDPLWAEWLITAYENSSLMDQRETDFLERHGLKQQFLDEDAKGER